VLGLDLLALSSSPPAARQIAMWKSVDALVAFFIVAGLPTGARGGSVERVIDGDDFACAAMKFVRQFAGRSRKCEPACVGVRLCGIDTPERGRPGGGEAAPSSPN
jgi:endonuclease YncB( thermonuclease family)